MSVGKMLKGHDLFASLSVEEMNQISNLASSKTYAADETIFKYNGAGSHVYMLMSGSVYLRLPANAPDFSFVISKIEMGELFGLSPLLDSPRYTSTAQCTEECEVLAIEAKPFRELLRNNHLVGFNIMNQVAHIYFSRYIAVLKNVQSILNQIPLIR